MSRPGRPGRPPKPISDETWAQVEKCLEDGWPFQEITRTHGIGYRRLVQRFPGRQWTPTQAALHGVLVRQTEGRYHAPSARSGRTTR